VATRPYEPLLLRLLHGVTGLSTIAAIVTAYWTYDTYDGRLGSFLPKIPAMEGIHGTFGLYALLSLPPLLLYACHRGAGRLAQPDSVAKLSQLDRPIGRYSLHRLINTAMLLALTFAVFTGKMMDVYWLPLGELQHAWYTAHLISWVVMVLAIAAHLLSGLAIGGVPFLQSIWHRRYRRGESPKLWRSQLRCWWDGWPTLRREWRRLPLRLQSFELAIALAWVAAWIAPVLR